MQQDRRVGVARGQIDELLERRVKDRRLWGRARAVVARSRAQDRHFAAQSTARRDALYRLCEDGEVDGLFEYIRSPHVHRANGGLHIGESG